VKSVILGSRIPVVALPHDLESDVDFQLKSHYFSNNGTPLTRGKLNRLSPPPYS
jgi:hypothetical protein